MTVTKRTGMQENTTRGSQDPGGRSGEQYKTRIKYTLVVIINEGYFCYVSASPGLRL